MEKKGKGKTIGLVVLAIVVVLAGFAAPLVLANPLAGRLGQWQDLALDPVTYHTPASEAQPVEDKPEPEPEPEPTDAPYYAALLHANPDFDETFEVQSAYEGEDLTANLAHLREQLTQLTQAGILPEVLYNAVVGRLDNETWEMAFGRNGAQFSDEVMERQIVMRTDEIWLFQADLAAETGKVVAFSVNIDALYGLELGETDTAPALEAFVRWLELESYTDWQSIPGQPDHSGDETGVFDSGRLESAEAGLRVDLDISRSSYYWFSAYAYEE